MSAWPNFFIVGAAKAGTTTLHRQLSQHPEICMSSVKEPHYFADVTPPREMRHLIKVVDDPDAYARLFRKTDRHSAVGEASPSYLFDGNSATRIRQSIPNARIIVLLRDPIERAYSHYLMDVREGIQPLTFMDALLADERINDRHWGTRCHLYVDLGMYAAQISRYLSEFSRTQILILESANLRTDALNTLRDVSRFLGVNPQFFDESVAQTVTNTYREPRSKLAAKLLTSRPTRRLTQKVVPARVRQALRRQMTTASKKPSMDPAAYEWLRAKYAPDLAKLRQSLDMELKSLSAAWF